MNCEIICLQGSTPFTTITSIRRLYHRRYLRSFIVHIIFAEKRFCAFQRSEMTTYAMLVHYGTVFEAQCHSCPANRLNWRYMVHLGYCMVNVYKLTSIKVDFFDMDHNVPGLEGQGSEL